MELNTETGKPVSEMTLAECMDVRKLICEHTTQEDINKGYRQTITIRIRVGGSLRRELLKALYPSSNLRPRKQRAKAKYLAYR